MAGVDKEYLSNHRQFRIRNKKLAVLFPVFAVIIAILVFWWLKLVGITVTGDAFCGLDEHTHGRECYTMELICDVEETTTETTENTETTETAETTKTAETTQQAHEHTSECIEKTLICTLPEHTHSAECFPDKTADTETVSDWLKTIENVTITNDVAENLAAVALTQKGYKESELNFEFDENGEKRSYTRYGEWYGNPYMKWNTLFVSFCINYANINNSDELENATAENMILAWQKRNVYSAADGYQPQKGDVVFFDTNSDGKADLTGIVTAGGNETLIVIEGDVDGKVDTVAYTDRSSVLGYGTTGELYAANHLNETVTEETTTHKAEVTEPSGMVNNYIAEEETTEAESTTAAETTEEESNDEETTEAEDTTESEETTEETTEENTSEKDETGEEETEEAEDVTQVIQGGTFNVFSSEPLMVFATPRASIEYTSHLEQEIVNAIFKNLDGTIIENNSTVYIGQSYVVSLEFSETNSGNTWLQFRHNEDGYLTYYIPSSLQCEPFTSWHPISATTENGTIEDVGQYFVDENGLLMVEFFDDANGVNFVEKYTNVDFTIDFSATVASTQSGTTAEVVFSDEIRIELNIDGGAAMTVSKTHGQFDSDDNTMEYTIRVEATKGVVKDLVIDDQIWENHYTLRDTIVVTDLDGNVITPQPTVSDHPSHNNGAEEGFRISGFPDFAAGDGFLITYKTQIYDYLLSNETVDMWNGLDSTGKDSNGNNVYVWTDDWLRVELEKMEKDGKQAVLEDDDGNPVPVIEWEIEIKKTNSDLQGTVIVDTLGNGLEYYTDKSIRVKCYDQWGNRMDDVYIEWDDVTVNGSTMSFPLPEGYGFDVVYYTTYEELDEGETKTYTNTATVTINQKQETAGGSADVIGFIPIIRKSASGNDGQYAYFTIEAEVPAVIKDWGNFYLTDLAAFWSYDNNEEGYLYVENVPEDMVITAVTESGQTVIFTPYVEGGPIENTYILVAPAEGDQYHSFNVFFNTADADFESSKWILNEDATLTVTYKLPFDSGTGTEWEGPLTGDLTLDDVLLSGKRMANEAYLNYTDVIEGVATTTYEYAPQITKQSVVNEDGTIDYTVVFHNTIPGTHGDGGYLNASTTMAYFNDTFDEKLEYVPGSLSATCYDPWRDGLWMNKYRYNGTVEGNSMSIPASQFALTETNPDAVAVGWTNLYKRTDLDKYYKWVNAGGDFVFTYSLRVKDEYLYTTDHNTFVLDNTAELTWDTDGSSGPASESSEYETGLVDKHLVQQDSRLDFDIHINRRALDILEGSSTLTIEDTMTRNLSVYWDSIVLLYEDEKGNWIDFDSQESIHSYTVTYDPPNNRLTFVIPDSLHIRIDYTTLITESGLVSVNNAVRIDGKAEVSDIIDAIFRVEEHSGGASGSVHNITLLKQDGTTDMPLPDAVFLLYGPMGDPDATPPSGASESIIAENGTILHYIGSYTTGDDGSVLIETQYLTLGGPYALVETVAPQGYNLLTSPVYFYFYNADPDGIIQTVTTLLAVENFTGGFIIPETGGIGTLPLAIIGCVLMAFPVLYSTIRRKRERRLT